MEQAAQPAAPAVQRQPVETEIGALPADLWSLIGESAPVSQPTVDARVAGPPPVDAPAPLREEGQTIIAARPPASLPEEAQTMIASGPPASLPEEAQTMIAAPPPAAQPADAQRAVVHTAEQAPRQSVLQRHVDNEAVQRKAAGRESQPVAAEVHRPPELAPSLPVPAREAAVGDGYWAIPPEGSLDREPEVLQDVMQREVQIGEVTSEVEPAPANSGGDAPDVDELAQKVYSEIKRRLAVEFERFRRR
jgi:hypothetical protein